MIHRGNDMLKAPPPLADQAGLVTALIAEHTLTAGSRAYTSATDIIEIGFLPAGVQILRATLVGTGFAAGVTADVGFMSGYPGERTDRDGSDRTSNAAIFDNAAVDGANTSLAVPGATQIAPADENRSIGVILSANVTPAGQTLKLVLEYVA